MAYVAVQSGALAYVAFNVKAFTRLREGQTRVLIGPEYLAQ